MSQPFVGQLSLVGFNFAPVGWATAAGQILSISQNTALFSLLGTTYGGNGQSNFGLPNMQGNVALGFGQGVGLSQYDLGQSGGSQTVTLLATETPNHTHAPKGSAARTAITSPAGGSFTNSEDGNIYSASASPAAQMSPNIISGYGGSQPHNNMMPYQCLLWIIALQGVFPPRS
jgi:microcystin-dependent protein